tara:strand:+ start:1997 stop:3052 length:1056 start_codon:yes stop_codon:yes gene_type:complete
MANFFTGDDGEWIQPADYSDELASFEWLKGSVAELMNDLAPKLAEIDERLRITGQNVVGSTIESMYDVIDSSSNMLSSAANTWQGITDDYANTIQAYGTAGEQDRMAAQAGQDQAQAFDAGYDQLQRKMAAKGMNLSNDGGALANSLSSLQNEKAAIAGAQTLARDDAKRDALALQSDAAKYNLDLNTAGQQGLALATDMGGAAANVEANTAKTRTDTALAPLDVTNAAAGLEMDTATIKGRQYDERIGSSKHQSSTKSGGLLGTVMNIATNAGSAYAGKKVSEAADGGAINAPGGPTDDAGLMALSDGEYVIPADVVNQLGANILDKFVSKSTGRPAPEPKTALPISGAM